MSATTTRFIKVAVGDVVIPTNREEHSVIAVAGTRVLVRDADGDRWLLHRRRIDAGEWMHRDSPPRSAHCPRWGGPPGSVPSEHGVTIAGGSRRTGHEQRHTPHAGSRCSSASTPLPSRHPPARALNFLRSTNRRGMVGSA